MGFLDVGAPIEWHDSKVFLATVKDAGIEQLLHIWRVNRDRIDETLLWGDEIEYHIIEVDHDGKTARIALCAEELLRELAVGEALLDSGSERSDWRPEYTNYMIEALPGEPFLLHLDDVLKVEASLNLRRCKITALLKDNQCVVSLTAFPHLGCSATDKRVAAASGSVFLSDEVMSPHPRFGTLTKNIRSRRGAKIMILVPLEQDLNTEKGYLEGPVERTAKLEEILDNASASDNPDPIPGTIYMDCMGFGMGLCCLQATFGARTIGDARYLYDQFVVLSPLWLALTAATPFLRGMVAATDTRWETISQSVDCRTLDEIKTIHKSRYAGASLYISDESPLQDRESQLNDVTVAQNEAVYRKLLANGLDSTLAKHYAYLFIRDPMVIYSDKIDLDNTKESAHFENIQSTNWNSVRFKPPPHSQDGITPNAIGWRVEFRTPEAQLTEFENAAVASVIAAIAQAIVEERWDLYIPISKVDENMRKSSAKSAIIVEKFWFRCADIHYGASDRSVAEMSLHEILFGVANGSVVGIMNLLRSFISGKVSSGQCSLEAAARLEQYIRFFEKRTSGEKPTNATFLRSELQKHADYKFDSVVPPSFTYDLALLASGKNDTRTAVMQQPSLLHTGAGEEFFDRSLLFESDGNKSSSSSGNVNFGCDASSGVIGTGRRPSNSAATTTPTSRILVSNEDFTRFWLAGLPKSLAAVHPWDVCSTCCTTSTMGCDDTACSEELSDVAQLCFEDDKQMNYYREIFANSG